MYLKRLEIQGFKSFANKTTLEFERGITGVVGPNGSGKSNIADSIRWVLGEQSLKQLRGKKSEDVIFAGSEKKARLSFAEVTVTFDNEDRKIPVDYGEVSITRRIDRSGESDYLINGNKVRLLDVVDLILKSNINTSRYTVIGQGTIDQMILAGPAEIKNLIDEASGVKTYYLRRDKTLKRLETTAQNSMRVQDLLAEIEPRLKSLRRQAKRMQERAVIEEELKTLQSEFYSGKYWAIQGAISGFSAKLAVIDGERKKLEHEIESHLRNLEKVEQNNRGEIEDYQKIQLEIKRLTDNRNKLIEDISLIRGKLQAEKGGTPGVAGDKKHLDIEKNNLENSRRALQSELEKTEKARAQIEAQAAKQREIFAEFSRKLSDLQSHLDAPDHAYSGRIADDVEALDISFTRFYKALQTAAEVSELVPLAEGFRADLGNFKQKAAEFSKNPFADFEKQRKALQELLFGKDKISQELNRLDLEKSKVQINSEYLGRELAKLEQKLLQTNLELQSATAESPDEYFKQLLAQEQTLSKEIVKVGESVSALEQKISDYHAKEQARREDVLGEERAHRAKQDALSKLKDQESALSIEKAKLDTQKDGLSAEALAAIGSERFAAIAKEHAGHSGAAREGHSEALAEKIRKFKGQLDMIGGIDELTMKEYQETEQRFTYLSSQVEDLQKAMADLREVIEELDAYTKKQFHNSFSKIDEKFQSYFRVLFNGGRAYLSVIRPAKEQSADGDGAEDGGQIEGEEGPDAEGSNGEAQGETKLRPEEKIVAKYEKQGDEIAGIDIKATPPGKKLATISALSGGERALTSIALLCALLSCFPSPFVVLDEVDAALDEANTIRFAEILSTIEKETQFIAVTHNRETMRKAHTLYGVTMGDDSISKILSIKIDQAQVYAK